MVDPHELARRLREAVAANNFGPVQQVADELEQAANEAKSQSAAHNPAAVQEEEEEEHTSRGKSKKR